MKKLVVALDVDIAAAHFIGVGIGIAIELILSEYGLREGTYDMYAVTITGEKMIPMTDRYKSFTETIYVVDNVIGNKHEWHYWGTEPSDLIHFG